MNGAWAFLLVSREGGGQGDSPSPSVNGPVENSSGQLTADSVAGLQGPAGYASLCLRLSSKHVQFLLLQRRGKLAACRRRAKPGADAQWDAFGWRPEVSPCPFPFLSPRSRSVPGSVRSVGDALCGNVAAMSESSQKYLDKAATKSRALVPNEPAQGKCVLGGCLFSC